MNHNLIEPLDRVFLEIGPLTIYWYAVFILTGAMLAMFLGMREAKKMGIDPEFILDLVAFGIPISVIGARLYYVAFELSYYLDNPAKIFKINEGGLAIHGAFITALTWGYFYSKYKKVDFIKLTDLGAVGFLIAQAIGRWGNFMNQEAHGGVVPGATLDDKRAFLDNTLHLPKFIVDQMYINGTYVHPTFLYESIWNIIGFGIALVLRRTKLPWVGDLMLFYFVWYSLGRVFIEGMRTDSLYLGPIRIAQLISILMMLTGIVLFIIRRVTKWRPERYIDNIEVN